MNLLFNWGQKTALRARNPKTISPSTPKTTRQIAIVPRGVAQTDPGFCKLGGKIETCQRMVPFRTLKPIDPRKDAPHRAAHRRTPLSLQQPPDDAPSHQTSSGTPVISGRCRDEALFPRRAQNRDETILRLPCSTSATLGCFSGLPRACCAPSLFPLHPLVRTLQTSEKTHREAPKKKSHPSHLQHG